MACPDKYKAGQISLLFRQQESFLEKDHHARKFKEDRPNGNVKQLGFKGNGKEIRKRGQVCTKLVYFAIFLTYVLCIPPPRKKI
jgi:hypothetical protein